MNNKAILITTALILALSAVSCGKEDSESSVSIAYGEATKTVVTEEIEDTTEKEKTTKATTTAKTTETVSGTGTGTVTATTASTVSGTETATTSSVEETSSETTTSAENSDVLTTATETTASTSTTVKAETTAPATTAETTAENTTESDTSAPDENSGNDNDNNNNDDNSNNDNNNDNNSNNDDNNYDPPSITLPPDNPEPATATATRPADNTFDFQFKVDNLLNDASGLLAMLGTPTFSGEAPGCTSNGNDVKIYQYDGLEIQCYIDGATEYIFSIEITGDRFVTDHNIKTGCTRAEVETAYGTGETSGNMTVYYTGNNEMDIEYNEDNTVKSIFFYAPV
ncbi:MAG: hypothetical protein K2G36_03880 [Ruminococcus sp.]|nr:hypothetical protein [Ruminococcus sp.]